MSDNILVDTAFWIGLLDSQDQHHSYATERAEWLEIATLIVPWPILYETVRTRLVRRRERFAIFDIHLKRPQVVMLDDTPYREDAYSLSLEFSLNLHRPVSMVDMLCRLLIEDVNVKIDAILTPNEVDFLDVCMKTGTAIL